MYINTVKQLGIAESTNSKKEQGRVVSSRPLTSIERQLFKTHYDGYQPRMPRQLATAIKRYIHSKPKHERKRPDFVGEIRRKILCLHEYNLQVAEVKRKYPRSQYFDGLLVQYIKLECDLFYNTHEIITEDDEKASRQRLLRFLKVILHDSYHTSDTTVRETNKLCDKTLLKLFATVRVDLDGENKFVDNIIVKMVEKLNLLEDINKLKGRHVEMLKDPEARKIRKTLSTSDYESDSDTSSDDDVKTSSFNGNFSSKQLISPTTHKANSVPCLGISNTFHSPWHDTIKTTSTLCENFSGSSQISTANSTKTATIERNCDVMDDETSFKNIPEIEKVHSKQLCDHAEQLNHPAINQQNHSFQNLNTFNNVGSNSFEIDYGHKTNNAFSAIGKAFAEVLNKPILDHSKDDVIIIDDDDDHYENTIDNNHQSNSDNILNTTFLQPVQIKLEENENRLPKFSLEKSNHLNFLGITKPPTGKSAEFNGFRTSFGGSGQIVDNVDIVISDSEDECHKDIVSSTNIDNNATELGLEEKEMCLQKFSKPIKTASNKTKNEKLCLMLSDYENTSYKNEITPESNNSNNISNTTTKRAVAYENLEEIFNLSESITRQKTPDKSSETQHDVKKNGNEISKTIMLSRASKTAENDLFEFEADFQINQITNYSTEPQKENIVAISYTNADEADVTQIQNFEESIAVPTYSSALEYNLEKRITNESTTSFNLKNDTAETQLNKIISIEPIIGEQFYLEKVDTRNTDEVLSEQVLTPAANWFPDDALQTEFSSSAIKNLQITKNIKPPDVDESQDVLAAIERLINGVLEKEQSSLLTENPKSLIHSKCTAHDSNETNFVDEDGQNEQNIAPLSDKSNQFSNFTDIVSDVVKVSANQDLVSLNSSENPNTSDVQTRIPIKTNADLFDKEENILSSIEIFTNDTENLRTSLRSLIVNTEENIYSDYTFDNRLSPGSSVLEVSLEKEVRDVHVDDELLSNKTTAILPDASDEVTVSSLVSEEIDTDIHLHNATKESLTETSETLSEVSSDSEGSLQKKVYPGANKEKFYISEAVQVSLEVNSEGNHVAHQESSLEVSTSNEDSFQYKNADLDANREEHYTLEDNSQVSLEESDEEKNVIVTCLESPLEVACNSIARLEENLNINENSEEWCTLENENEKENLVIGQKLSVEVSSKSNTRLHQYSNTDANAEEYCALEDNQEETNVDTSHKSCFEVLSARDASSQQKNYTDANEKEIMEAPQIYLEENNEIINEIICHESSVAEPEQIKYLESNSEKTTENLVEGELNLGFTSSGQNRPDTLITKMGEYKKVIDCSDKFSNEEVLQSEILTFSVSDALERDEMLENLSLGKFKRNKKFIDKVQSANITMSNKNDIIALSGQEDVDNGCLSMEKSPNFTNNIALDLSNKEEIGENNTECLTYFKKRQSCDKKIDNGSTFCGDNHKVKNITEKVECLNQNEDLQNNISSIRIEKCKTGDSSSKRLNEILNKETGREVEILPPSFKSNFSQQEEATGLSFAYFKDENKQTEEVICDTETVTLEVCGYNSTGAESSDIVDKDLPNDVRECSVILQRSQNFNTTTNTLCDVDKIYKHQLNLDRTSRTNESVASGHILNDMSLKYKTKYSEILEENSKSLNKTITNMEDESTELMIDNDDKSVNLNQTLVKDTASTQNDYINALNISKNAEITECSVILKRNIVNHVFKNKSADVGISDGSADLNDTFVSLEDNNSSYHVDVIPLNKIHNSSEEISTCSRVLDKAQNEDCATGKKPVQNVHLKNRDITECSVILQRNDSTLGENNWDCAVLDNEDNSENDNLPKSKSNINLENLTIPVCDMLYYNNSAISSTLDEVEYVEPAIEKKTNLDMLATLAVKRKDKDKSFNVENCTKMETDINRITRRSFSKRKLDFGDIGQPHDFISMESPILTPRTNNVYDQQKAVEANTTSEDSNDSCENSLYIDLNEKTAAVEALSIFDEETKWDMLEFITSEKSTSSAEGSSQESLQGKSIPEFAASQMLIYEKKVEAEQNINASASKQNVNVVKEGKTHSKSRVKKTDHSIQNILSKTSAIIESNLKADDTVGENDEAKSTSSNKSAKKSDIEFSEIENKSLIQNRVEDPSCPYILTVDESSSKLVNMTEKEPEDWTINTSDACSSEKIFRTKAEVKSYENKLQKGSPSKTLPISTRTRLRLKSSEDGKKGRSEETNLKDGEKKDNSVLLKAEQKKPFLKSDTEEVENSKKTFNDSEIEKFGKKSKNSTLKVSSNIERTKLETSDCIATSNIILTCESKQVISSPIKSNICSKRSPVQSEDPVRRNKTILTKRSQILNTTKNRHKDVKDGKISVAKNKLRRSDQAKEISLENTIKKMKESKAEFEISKNETNVLRDNKTQADDTSMKEIDEVKKGSRNNKKSKSSATSSKQDNQLCKEKDFNEVNLSKSRSLTLRERKGSYPQISDAHSLSAPNSDAESAGRRRSKSRSVDNKNEHTKTQNRKRLSSTCNSSTEDLHLAKKQKSSDSKSCIVNQSDNDTNLENEKATLNLEISVSQAKEAHSKKSSSHKKHGKANKIGKSSTETTKVVKNAKPVKETRRTSLQLTETPTNNESEIILNTKNQDSKANNKAKTKEGNHKLLKCSKAIDANESSVNISKGDKITSLTDKRKLDSKNKTSTIHNKKSKKSNDINCTSKSIKEKVESEIHSHIETFKQGKSNHSGISDTRHAQDVEHFTSEDTSCDLSKQQSFVESSNKKNKALEHSLKTSQATHVHTKEKKYFADIPKKRKYSFPEDNNFVDNCHQNVKIPKVNELNKEVAFKEDDQIQGITNSIDFKSATSSLTEQVLDVTLNLTKQEPKKDLYDDTTNELLMSSLRVVKANKSISSDGIEPLNAANDITDSLSNTSTEIDTAFKKDDAVDNLDDVNKKDNNSILIIDESANTSIFPVHETITVGIFSKRADEIVIGSQSTCEQVPAISLLKDEDSTVKRLTPLASGDCCEAALTVVQFSNKIIDEEISNSIKDTNNFESTMKPTVNEVNNTDNIIGPLNAGFVTDCDITITSAGNATDSTTETNNKILNDIVIDEITDPLNTAAVVLEQSEITNTTKECIENISANDNTGLSKTAVADISTAESTLGEISTDGLTNKAITDVNKMANLSKILEEDMTEDTELLKTAISEIATVESTLGEIIQKDEFTNESITDVNKIADLLKSPQDSMAENTDLKSAVADNLTVESTSAEIIQIDEVTSKTETDDNKMVYLLKSPKGGMAEDTDLITTDVADIPTVESSMADIIQTDEHSNKTMTDVIKMADLLRSSEDRLAKNNDLLKPAVADIPTVESTLTEIIQTDEHCYKTMTDVNKMADLLKSFDGGMTENTNLLKTAVADISIVESTFTKIIQTDELTNKTRTDVNKAAKDIDLFKTAVADISIVESTLTETVETDAHINETTGANKMAILLRNPKCSMVENTYLLKTAVAAMPTVESTLSEIIQSDDITNLTTTVAKKMADLLKDPEGGGAKDTDLLKTVVADILSVESTSADELTNATTTDVDKTTEILENSEGGMAEDTDLLVADIPTVESRLAEIIQTTECANEATTDVNKIADLLKIPEIDMTEDTDLLQTTVADIPTVESLSTEIIQTDELTNETTTDVSKQVDLLKKPEEETKTSKMSNTYETTNEPPNEIIGGGLSNLVQNEIAMNETVDTDKITEQVTNDLAVPEVSDLLENIHDERELETTVTETVTIGETTFESRKIRDNIVVALFKTTNKNSTVESTSTELTTTHETTNKIANHSSSGKVTDSTIFDEDAAPEKEVTDSLKDTTFDVVGTAKVSVTNVSSPKITEIISTSKLEINVTSDISSDKISKDSELSTNNFVTVSTFQENEISNTTKPVHNNEPEDDESKNNQFHIFPPVTANETSVVVSSIPDIPPPVKLLLQSSDISEIPSEKSILADNVYSTASGNFHVLAATVDSPVKHFTVDDRNLTVTSMTSASGSIRCRSNIAEPSTSTGCSSNQDYTYPGDMYPGDPLLGGGREEKFNPFASDFTYSNSDDFQMNEDVSSYMEDDPTLVDPIELFACKGEKSDFGPIIDDSSEKDTEDVKNSIEDKPDSNDSVYGDTTDNSKSFGIQEAIDKLLILSDAMLESNKYTTLKDINNINIIEGNDSQIMADKGIGPININASFLPSEEKKVLVEQIEQCPIIPFEPINEDYLIESNIPPPEVEEKIVKQQIDTNKKTTNKSRPFKITITKPKEKPKDELETFIAKKATRPVLAIKKSKIVNDINENKYSKNSLLKEGRIRVKTDLIIPKSIDDSISNLDYIREDQQSVASEITLPFSHPSPDKITKGNTSQKNVEPSSLISLAAKYDDKSEKDVKFPKSLPNFLKGEESQVQNPAHIETNKKRKISFEGVKNAEKQIEHSEKKQKKPDSVEKTKDTHNVSQLSNFDKVKESGITNKFFNQKTNEKSKDVHIKKLQNVSHRMHAQPTMMAANLSREALPPENVRNLKNRGSSITTTPENLPNRGYSTFPDSRESYKHRTRHPSSDTVRDSKIHSYYRGKRIPYHDQNHKRNQRENSTTGDPDRRYDKRTFPHNNHKPDTSSSRHMRTREEKRSLEQERAHQSSYKGSAGRTQDDYQWLKKFNQSDFWNQRDDLFKPAEPKNEASTTRK